MMQRFAAAACLAAAMLGACGQAQEDADTAALDAAPPPPAESVEAPVETVRATERAADIDWTAARTDLASRGEDDPAVAAASAAFQIQSGVDAPPVPVLLPSGVVSVQSDGAGPSYKPLSDGYYARYPGLDYDVVVHGTNIVADVEGAPRRVVSPPEFTPMLDGGQVALSRYGADYLVSFECKQAEGGELCITPEEAMSVAESLVIVGTR